MHTDDERLETLGAYLRILKTGTASREEYDRYAEVLSSANAFEVNAAIHAALAEETDMDSWKIPVARFIRATAHTVESAPLPDYPEGHLLQTLEAENAALGEFLIILQQAARSRETRPVASLRTRLAETDPISPHYVRLQNELVPLFELSSREHACVKLMWAIQDDILAMRKRLLDPDAIPDDKTFLRFGEFYRMRAPFLARGISSTRLPSVPSLRTHLPVRVVRRDRRVSRSSQAVPACSPGPNLKPSSPCCRWIFPLSALMTGSSTIRIRRTASSRGVRRLSAGLCRIVIRPKAWQPLKRFWNRSNRAMKIQPSSGLR